MKKLASLLIILLLILGCNKTIPGCLDVQACNYDPDANTNDSSCKYIDCNEECGGDSILDNCGICDNIPANDCVEDCNGFWGGTAEQLCEFCIPFDEIVPDFEGQEHANNIILELCDTYNDIFSSTYNVELSDADSSFHFLPSTGNNKVLISAPHSQQTYRYTTENSSCSLDEIHDRDMRTGVIAKILHDYTGAAIIYKRYKSDDPNYHDMIPECTLTNVFQGDIESILPYKQKILDYINENSNIKFVMDLHGFNPSRPSDVYIGTMDGESLESNIGECLPDIITHILVSRWNISTSENSYQASSNESVTKFIHNYIDDIVDAIQFEIDYDYRSCENNNITKMIKALIEVIMVSNYLYEL